MAITTLFTRFRRLFTRQSSHDTGTAIALGLAIMLSTSTIAADMTKTLRTAFRAAETGFDPAQVADVFSYDIMRNIFDTLLTYDYLARPATLTPNLCEAMPEVSDNATNFVFKIRKGIYFTPDPAFKGKKRELTAEDFVYSFKRLIDPKLHSPSSYVLDGKLLGADEVLANEKRTGKFDYDIPMTGLAAPDRYTLHIRLAHPDHNLLYFLASVSMSVVAREVVEAAGMNDIMGRAIGTGPYILKSWVRGSKIILEANPDYRSETYHATPGNTPEDRAAMAAMQGKTLPAIGRVEVSIIEEAQPMWLAFLGNRLDYIEVPPAFNGKAFPGGALPPDLVKRGIQRQRETAGTFYTFFNMEDKVVGGYTDEKIALRRAIILGYNLPEEITQVYNGQAVPAQTPMSPSVAGYDATFRSGIGYDPELARRLLDRFGYKDRDGDGYRELPNGRPLVIEMGSTSTTQDQLTAEVWKKSMDAIGIKVTFLKQQWPDLVKAARLGKLQMWHVGWAALIPDGDTYLQLLYGPNKTSNNMSRFDLKEFNLRYERAHEMPDNAERKALYREMTLLALGYSPWHMGLHRIDNYLNQPWLVGYVQHPYLTNAWKYLDIREDRRPHDAQ